MAYMALIISGGFASGLCGGISVKPVPSLLEVGELTTSVLGGRLISEESEMIMVNVLTRVKMPVANKKRTNELTSPARRNIVRPILNRICSIVVKNSIMNNKK